MHNEAAGRADAYQAVPRVECGHGNGVQVKRYGECNEVRRSRVGLFDCPECSDYCEADETNTVRILGQSVLDVDASDGSLDVPLGGTEDAVRVLVLGKQR